MRLDDIYKKIEALDEALNETASASINMSGDSAEDVIKLMNALKGGAGADSIDSIPTAIKKPIEPMPVMGPPEDDMAKLRDIVKGPDMDKDMDKDMDDLKPGDQSEPCPICGKNHLGASSCNDAIDNDEAPIEGYENEPDEKYQDQNYMTKDLSGGSEQGQKKSYPKVAGGDNPMALEDEIRAELAAKLKEHMSESKGCPCCGGGECECDADCPDCDCNTNEGMDHKHDDEGKCPECGKPGKKKLMACASCGCK